MTSLWLASVLLGAVAQNSPESLLGRGSDVNLAAKTALPPRPVNASQRQLFGLDWRQPVVRMGFNRRVGATFGRPGLSPRFGLAIFGTGEGDVRAVHIKDGAEAWTYAYGEPFETTVNVFTVKLEQGAPTDLAILGSRDGTLLALDAQSGRLVWKLAIEGDMRSPAARDGTLLVVTTVRNQVIALDIGTGEVRWTAGRPPPGGTLTISGHSKPLIANNMVYATFSDGYVEAYSTEDGARAWSRPLSLKGGDFVDSDADPVLLDGRLFVASYSDGVYALNPADGQTLWSRAGPAINRLAVSGNDTLVAGSGDGWVWGLSPDDGRLLFRTRLGQTLVSRLETRDNLILLSAGDRGLVILDGRTGKPLQATSFGTRMQNDPIWLGNQVALLSASGYLYSFSRD